MSDETTTQEPVDDAVIVNDEQKAETDHQELVDKVAKLTGRDEWGDTKDDAKSVVTDEPAIAAETTDETPSEAEAKDEKPALSDDLKSRAEKAGFTTELAEQLHQNGQLEDTLTAFDRTIAERFQAEKPEEKPEPEKAPVEEVAKEEMPELDPDVYDDEIVKRDRYYRQQLAAQDERIESLLQDRQDAFDGWLDESFAELGYDIKDEEKCQRTYKAYKGLCDANDVSPEKRDKALLERAHAAMYPEDVKKQTQKETVDRLRSAEGKFLPSAKSTGEPPQRAKTEEEAHSAIVAKVAAYGKKNGIDWGG